MSGRRRLEAVLVVVTGEVVTGEAVFVEVELVEVVLVVAPTSMVELVRPTMDGLGAAISAMLFDDGAVPVFRGRAQSKQQCT